MQQLVIGLVLLGLNMIGMLGDPDWIRFAALGVQIELILTAVAGWCPLYWSFGANSCAVANGVPASRSSVSR
jgi:hypothetical protein